MLSFLNRKFRNNFMLFSVCNLLTFTSVFAQTGTWSALTTTAPHTSAGVMVLMTDGTVLCKNSSGGGQGTGWDKLTPDATGSYKNGTWSSIASMARDRLYFSSQILPDGRLYVCGGEYGAGGRYGEVYNPKTNTWTTAGGAGWVFASVVSDANSEILYNGNVLQAVVDASGTDSNYIWNPVTNTYTKGPKCLRVDNEAMWVKLPDSSTIFIDNYSTTSERYIPSLNIWQNDATVPVNLYDPYGFEAGAAFMLPDGRAFFIGSTPTTAYYTPSGNTTPGTFAAGPAIPLSRGVPDGASAMMVNGVILLAVSATPSSSSTFPSPTYYYEFDYTTNTFTQVGAPGGGMSTANSCYISNMLDLPDGTVLFVNQGSNRYYQYTPGTAPLAAGQPTIGTITRINCDTFQVTGTLFNGICEGAGYGDDWQMETNYPIVRLSAGGNTYYATTYNWNRIGAVQTGALPDTAIFVIPAALPIGTYSVVLTANGNPSAPFTINTSLAISPSPVTLCVGANTTLTDVATIGYWSSANTGIATVGSTTGIATGVALGTTTISYSIGQCFSTVNVTVNALAPITGTLTVCQGAVTPLTDAVTGGTWSSTTGNATVGTTGIVTGVTPGTSTISYVAPSGCATSVNVTVNPAPTATITASGATTFCLGSNVTLNATPGAGYTYQWQIGGGNIGGATNSSYVATLGGNYTVIITNANGCSATSAVTVVTTTAGPGATITPAGPTTFCTGGSVVLNANTGAGLTYQWQVGGVNIPGATLSSYTATLGGSYTVIVSQGICVITSSPTVVTVNSAPSVTPISGSSNVCTGLTTTLTDGTAGGIWTSSTGTATVGSSSGVVTGVSAGTATITYTFTNSCGSVFTTATITVNASTAVAAIAGSVNVCTGNTLSLTDATSSGVWSSSNTGVATISGTGIVTGVTAGTATISYTVTNAAGCVSSAVTTITVYSPSSGTITPLSSTTFCSGGYVTLSATTGSGYTYQWQSGGINIPGATSSTYTANTSGNYTVIIYYPGGCSASTAAVIVTVTGGSIVTPAVGISASFGDTVCTTSTASTFTAVPVNGGTTPTYQWYVNGGAPVGVGATYTYLPANGDVITCVLTSNATCAFPDTAIHSITMTVSPILTPSVSITSIHNDSTCTGDTVLFAAVPVYGGTAPTYLWTENGINVATGPYYIYQPHNGDTLIVTMTSNYPCLSTSIAVSNMFIMHVLTPTVNALSVSVSQSNIISGSVDTFTAIATGAGASPSFQWYIDGNSVAGATSYRYITDSLRDGQIVNCYETSSYLCSDPHSIFSGGITISVQPNSIKQIGTNTGNFMLIPNPNNGTFTIKGSLRSPSDDKINIAITNVLGQAVYRKTTFAKNGNVNELITLTNTIAPGTYQVSITSGEDHMVFHVVIE